VFLCHCVDAFVPGGLYTVCKKQVCCEANEAVTYKALMDDTLSEVIPKFYREFTQNDEGKLISSFPHSPAPCGPQDCKNSLNPF